VLGIGAEDAVVRLTAIPRGTSRPAPEPAPEPRPQPAPRPERQESRPSQPRTEPKPAPATAPAPASATAAPAAPLAGTPEERANAAAEKGRELLLGILERMGLDADVEIVEQSEAEVDDDDRALVLNIVGDDLGMLIGRQNETLSAIEFVTRLMVNQQVRTRTSFVVDVNGYRAKRAESLRKLALRMAEQVAESGRTVALEPMPPAERRIIHLALRDNPKVGTQSVGEGDRRKVTLVPKK
jgi:spoIIIJ-associated protein